MSTRRGGLMRRGGERPRGGLMRRGGGDLQQATHSSHQCQAAGIPCRPYAASSWQPKATHPCHAPRSTHLLRSLPPPPAAAAAACLRPPGTRGMIGMLFGSSSGRCSGFLKVTLTEGMSPALQPGRQAGARGCAGEGQAEDGQLGEVQGWAAILLIANAKARASVSGRGMARRDRQAATAAAAGRQPLPWRGHHARQGSSSWWRAQLKVWRRWAAQVTCRRALTPEAAEASAAARPAGQEGPQLQQQLLPLLMMHVCLCCCQCCCPRCMLRLQQTRARRQGPKPAAPAACGCQHFFPRQPHGQAHCQVLPSVLLSAVSRAGTGCWQQAG